MATTQDTTAIAADHQQTVEPARRAGDTHDWRTCADHADCRRRAKRQADKAAARAMGMDPKENAQYVQDQLVVPWRRAALRIANGGNVEELGLLADALAAAREQMVEAIDMMRQADPEGASWSRVATALGLNSPQAAQVKYGRRRRA